MNDVLMISLTALLSVAALFGLTKLLGYRQISQMTLFDYITGITIGSLAAEMTVDPDHFWRAVITMIVYTLAAWCIALATNKSMKARRFFVGKSLILFDKGILYNENLRLAKMDIQEFQIQCRNSGYFDLAGIQTAVLEPNGKISILPKTAERPATPADLNLAPTQEHLVANVIVDGQILRENLKHTGRDEVWLQRQMNAQGVNDARDVFLATCDSQGVCRIYARTPERNKIDLFE